MSEQQGCSGIALYILSIIMPLPALIIGWVGWSFRIGVIAALCTYMLFFITGTILISRIKDPGWLMVASPFAMALLYLILPDAVFGQFDDTLVLFAGVFGSIVLASRKLGVIPTEAIFPLGIVAIYPLFGQFVPGSVDEILVGIIGTSIGYFEVYQYVKLPAERENSTLIECETDDEYIEDDEEI
jgi:hypothetical protein